MSVQDDRNNLIEGNGHFLIWLGAFCLFLILATGFGIWLLSGNNSQLPWMIIALGGFSILAVFLYSGSVLFRIFGLHDAKQAMGLPRNSVRSLLTFMIFIILMAFIFYSTHLLTPAQPEIRVYTFPAAQSATEQARIAKIGNIIEIIQSERAIKNEDGTKIATERVVHFKVEQASSNTIAHNQMREYLERILIALLSISSSIIGFYFGSRTGEGKPDPIPATLPDTVIKDAPPPPPTPEGTDFSISSADITLAPQEDGSFTGELTFASEDITPDRSFSAMFVPTEGGTKDLPTDNAKIAVTRVGNTLKLHVTGAEIQTQGIPPGAKIAVFLTDEEEGAQKITLKTAPPPDIGG